jgi:hypothetical protein
MPRLLLRRSPLPRLERGLELSRTQSEVMVQAYALVAPVLRRALPPTNATKPQGSKRQDLSRRAAVGG